MAGSASALEEAAACAPVVASGVPSASASVVALLAFAWKGAAVASVVGSPCNSTMHRARVLLLAAWVAEWVVVPGALGVLGPAFLVGSWPRRHLGSGAVALDCPGEVACSALVGVPRMALKTL